MKERVKYYDAAKGVLIILVIIGHVIDLDTCYWLRSWIYSFHMPAFFIISGMIYEPNQLSQRTYKEFINKKAKRLLIPYVLFETAGAFLIMLCKGTEYLNINGYLYNMVTINCNLVVDWFLPTLFFSEILFLFVIKQNPKMRFVLFTLIFVLGLAMPEYFHNHYITCIARCFIGCGFMLIGSCCRNILKKVSVIWIVSAFGLSLIIAYFNGFVSLVGCIYNNPVLYVAGGVLGTVSMLGVSRFIDSKMICEIGKNSLIIMGTHLMILQMVQYALGWETFPLAYQPLLFIVVVLLEVGIVSLWNKAKIRYFR